ncbi:MAG TPA: glycosyltransferase family 2 protein [Tepidiformaceae bacterium]|nr:glycosyltransferase family 2 protein [Tepidiformaceae bacterium]
MSPGIVIVTYECRDFAMRCLESIRRHMPAALPNVVIVDNASTDGTAGAVRKGFPGVKVIEKHRNVGFAAAANAGIRALPDCDVIVLLNPDSVLLDAGLNAAAEYLHEHVELGVLGVRIENEDGTLQPSCRAFPSYQTAIFNRHSLATKFAPRNPWSERYLMTDWGHDTVRPVDWVSGACMLIHRRAVQRAGLLDARYFFSIEDVDYCRRVHDAGLQVAYFPMARVRHLVGGSSRHLAYRAMAEHHRGMWQYYRTHMRGGRLLDIVTAGGILARLALHITSYTIRRLIRRGPAAQVSRSVSPYSPAAGDAPEG